MVSLGPVERRAALLRRVGAEAVASLSQRPGTKPDPVGVALEDVPYLIGLDAELLGDFPGDRGVVDPDGVGPLVRVWHARPRVVGTPNPGVFVLTGEARTMGGVARLLGVGFAPFGRVRDRVDFPMPAPLDVPEDVWPTYSVVCRVEGGDHGS